MRLVWRGGRPDLDLDAISLTPAQRAAVEAPAPVVVTAGAGSGKTHTLAIRYLRALLAEAWEADRPDLGAVRLLTFTDQAAREMRERAGARLQALRDAVAADPTPGAARLARALDVMVLGFPAARIGTFHAWCAAILQERPDLSQVPADARILDAAESRAWAREAATEALDAAILADPAVLRRVAAAFPSRRQTIEALVRLIDERHRVAAALDAWADGRVDAAALIAASPVSADDARAWLRGIARPLVARLRVLLSPGEGGLQARLDALAPRLDALPDDALDAFALYKDALDALLTRDGAKVRALPHAGTMGKKARWTSEAEHKSAKAVLQVLDVGRADWLARAGVAAGLPTPADLRMADALGPLAAIARDAVARLDARGRAERGIDFAELLGRAARVVAIDPAAAGRYREVLIDEFQDTDPLQWGLVRALGHQLFLVGDAKQAIYGFRGGDVGVFRVAADELGAARLGLPDNFRTRPAVIAVLNRWLAGVLGPDAPDRPRWEAPFEALSPARVAEGGTVRLAIGPKVSPDADAAREAAWIAADIAAQLDDPAIVAAPTPPIAVLIRARTRLAALEAGLRAHGVPYVVAGGVGFWSRPEVVDAVNALRVTAGDDPIAALGVLRGPIGAVPDDVLFAWGDADRLRGLAGVGAHEGVDVGAKPGPHGAARSADAPTTRSTLDVARSPADADGGPGRAGPLDEDVGSGAHDLAPGDPWPPGDDLLPGPMAAPAIDDGAPATDPGAEGAWPPGAEGRHDAEDGPADASSIDVPFAWGDEATPPEDPRAAEARDSAARDSAARDGAARATAREGPPRDRTGPAAPAAIAAVAATIRGWRALAAQVPAARLLDAITGPLVADAAARGDAAALANLDRLRDRVADLAARGLGLAAIAQDLAGRVVRDDREGEAPVDPGRARVIVMTVHAAKGLEWPIVYVMGAGERPRARPDTVAIARADAPPAATIAVPCGSPPPGTLVRLRAQERVEQLAEERRLLYVALTRARDHLVVTGTIDDEEADVPLGWLRGDGFGVPVAALPDAPVPGAAGIEAPPPLPTRPPPAPIAPPPIEIAPSALDAFAACPARWWRRHVAGEHERADLVDDPVRRLAGVRGEVLHGLLEDGLVDDEEVAWRRLVARALADGLPRPAVEASRPSLRRHLAALRDPRLQRALDAPGRAEVAFRVARGPIVLVGQIDRLWLDEGSHVVFDLKSGAADAPNPGDSDRQVTAYAWAADRLLTEAGLPGVSRAELYFTALGRWRDLGREGFPGLEAELDAVAAAVVSPWAVVEAAAIATKRPCAGCGFRGRGCRGTDGSRA